MFPARPPDDLLLSTAERHALAGTGLAAPAAHDADALGERLLAYIALTRPAQQLVLSYATVDCVTAGALLASSLLPEIRRALPDAPIERYARSAPPVHVGGIGAGGTWPRRPTSAARANRRAMWS